MRSGRILGYSGNKLSLPLLTAGEGAIAIGRGGGRRFWVPCSLGLGLQLLRCLCLWVRGQGSAICSTDRGYESYNLFAHLLRSGQKFVIRLKDDDSNGIISTYEFPYDKNGEFDSDINTILTWKQTNHVKENRQTNKEKSYHSLHFQCAF